MALTARAPTKAQKAASRRGRKFVPDAGFGRVFGRVQYEIGKSMKPRRRTR